MKLQRGVGGWRVWQRWRRAAKVAMPAWERGEPIQFCFVVETRTVEHDADATCRFGSTPDGDFSGFLRHPVAQETR